MPNNNKNKMTPQKAREALQEIESAIRGAEYVDDTWATVDVEVLKLCRDLLHKSIDSIDEDLEMTYLGKYVKDHGEIESGKVPFDCPCDYGYETDPGGDEDCPEFPNGRLMDCVACWDRKMPKKD